MRGLRPCRGLFEFSPIELSAPVLRNVAMEKLLTLANLLRGVLHLGLENLVGLLDQIANGGAHRSPL
jgi:hypothetical protein